MNMTMINDKTANSFFILSIVFAIAIATSTNTWAQADVAAAPSTTEQTIDNQQDQTTQDNQPDISRAMSPSTVTEKMKLLAKHFSTKSGQWIEGNPPFFAVWQADRSGQAKGALLILHAQGEHPSWPKTTQPLHDSLPDYGWATFALSLPSPPKEDLPQRVLAVKTVNAIDDQNSNNEKEKEKNQQPKKTAAQKIQQTPTQTSQTEEVDNSKEYIEYSQNMENRLTSAVQFLHDKGQFNIAILANGDNAIFAEQFMQSITPDITDQNLKDRFEKPIRALLIHNGSLKLQHEKEPYDGWFKDLEIPVFDAFTAHQRQYQQAARHRKIIAKRRKVQSYTMVRIPEMSYETSWGENRLSRRIRSFLDAKVKGVEIGNAQLKKGNTQQ